MVAIAYGKGVVMCKPYMGRINRDTFADIVESKFPGASDRTLRSIHLIKMKNSLLAQISSSSNPVQKVALEQLLIQGVKSSLCGLQREAERKGGSSKEPTCF